MICSHDSIGGLFTIAEKVPMLIQICFFIVYEVDDFLIKGLVFAS